MGGKLFIERVIAEHGSEGLNSKKAIESIKIEIDYMLSEMKLALFSADLESYLAQFEKLKALLPLAAKMNIETERHREELAKNDKHYKILTKKIAADELTSEELQESKEVEQEVKNNISHLLEDVEEFLVRTNIQQISVAASVLRDGTNISMDMSATLQTIDAEQLEKFEQRRVDIQRQKDSLAEQLEKWESKKTDLVKKKGEDVVTHKLDRQIAHCKNSLARVSKIADHPHFKAVLSLVSDVKVVIHHISVSDGKTAHIDKLSQAVHVISAASKMSFRDLVTAPDHKKTVAREPIQQ